MIMSTSARRITVALLLTTLILDLTVEGAFAGRNDKCWCEQENGCRHASTKNPDGREVIVVSNGSSTTGVWKWDSITTVITTYTSETRNNNNIACESHKRGKKYGFIMQLPSMLLNGSFPEKNVSDWKNTIDKRKRLWYADIVVLDLIDALKQPADKDLDSLDRLLEDLHVTNDNLPDEVYCLVPWAPPTGLNETTYSYLVRLLKHCQTLMLAPDSYLDASDERRCEAVPIIPFTEFIYGIEQYLNLKISSNPRASLVAGIPWHGYEYICDHLGQDGSCSLKISDGKCDITKQRQRKSLAEIHQQIKYTTECEKVDVLTQSAYCSFQDDSKRWRRLCFENHETLRMKYEMVNMLNIKGVSLWTAEDLGQGFTVDQLSNDGDMWNWVTHEMIQKTVSNPPQITHYYADTVAGAAIGCLLLGTALGITFTCIALRQCKRSPPKRPFKLDENVDDFHDDPGL